MSREYNSSNTNSFPFLAGIALGTLVGAAIGAFLVDPEDARQAARKVKDDIGDTANKGKEKLEEQYESRVKPKVDNVKSAVQNKARNVRDKADMKLKEAEEERA